MSPDDTDEFEVPALPPSPPVYERVEPRYFGVTPHALVSAAPAALFGEQTRRRKLALERSHAQYELGGAVHADDEARTASTEVRRP